MAEVRKHSRVLFLSFFFPPAHAIASVRTGNIAKHLSALGWDMTVVTPHPSLWHLTDPLDPLGGGDRSGVTMLYTGCRWRCLSSGNIKRAYDKSLRFYLEGVPRRLARMLGIDELIGWYPEVMRACAHMKPGDVDVILVSGGPFGAFPVAERLSRQLECPFVLDYRDFWTASSYGTKEWAHPLRNAAEHAVLNKCAAVSFISPSMARILSGRYGIDGKMRIVTNGYDKEEMDRVEPHEFGHFAIVYAGQFFPPRRTPDPIMRALAELEKDGTLPPWLFHFYGHDEEIVRRSAARYNVERRVVCHGMVPRRETLSAVRGAGVAVVVTSVEDKGSLQDSAVLPGKLYEPIGLGTNVVVICPRDSDAREVLEITGGGRAFTGADTGGIKEFLSRLIRGGTVPWNRPQTYAWQELGQQIDAMLRSAINAPQSIHEGIAWDRS